MWQDYVFMVGGLGFSIFLLPSILSKDKPARFTSFFTMIVLITFAVTYLTLSLNLAAVSTGLTAFLWFILFRQKRRK